jgi:hypothetical protein
MADYEFGFLMEQSLGHVTHTKILVAKVALDPEVHAHWGLVDFEATGIAARIPVYRSDWTVRAGVRACREVARMNRQTRLDALFFHTQVPAILAQRWLRRIPSIVSLDATPLQYHELGAFYKHEKGEAWKWHEPRLLQVRSPARCVVGVDKTRSCAGLRCAGRQDYCHSPGVDVQEWRRPIPRVPHTDPIKILFVGGDLERRGAGAPRGFSRAPALGPRTSSGD